MKVKVPMYFIELFIMTIGAASANLYKNGQGFQRTLSDIFRVEFTYFYFFCELKQSRTLRISSLSRAFQPLRPRGRGRR